MHCIEFIRYAIILLCCVWGFIHLHAALVIYRIPLFRDSVCASPSVWPRLSVIIPARNEAATLAAAARTLLQQDYPNLQIVLVNDRSDDDTATIIDGLAASDARVIAQHIGTLPDGWLGKVHAMDQGIRAADGDWLLFTDADVHFRKDTFRRAVELALHSGCGHLVLVPDTHTHTFMQAVVMSATRLMFAVSARLSQVGNPRSKAAIGVGAFNLVSRAAYDSTPGMAWLKMEVVDDIGLGVMLKQHGCCTAFAFAPEALWLSWYPDLPGMINGLEKNFYGMVAKYQPWRMVAAVAFIWLFALTPLLALLNSNTRPWALVYFLLPFTMLVGKLRFGDRLLPALFAPLGYLTLGYMLLRSGWHCIRRGGIRWRETFYPTALLKAGQRVKM